MSERQQNAASGAFEANAQLTWWERHGRRVSLGIKGALALLALGALVWKLALAPVGARSFTVARGTVVAEVPGTGTLGARTAASVGAKVSGLIVKMEADQGERVKAGAVLFRLDDADVRQQVAMSEAEAAAAGAALVRLEASLQRAKAVHAQAEAAHARVSSLVGSNAVSRQDLDKAGESLAIAQADLSAAATAITEGARRREVAERARDLYRARLGDTVVRAPFDALIVRREREAGDVVAAGTPVFRLVATEEMWVSAWVDETRLESIAPGQPARVEFRSSPGESRPGEVVRVGRMADPETRELVVDVRVKDLPANWAVGQRAEVFVRTAQRASVLHISPEFLLLRDGKPAVMVDEDGRARLRPVTTGLRGTRAVEVLDGLAEGERVLMPAAPGAAPLPEGRRVVAR